MFNDRRITEYTVKLIVPLDGGCPILHYIINIFSETSLIKVYYDSKVNNEATLSHGLTSLLFNPRGAKSQQQYIIFSLKYEHVDQPYQCNIKWEIDTS
jgi:hypothetical protein